MSNTLPYEERSNIPKYKKYELEFINLTSPWYKPQSPTEILAYFAKFNINYPTEDEPPTPISFIMSGFGNFNTSMNLFFAMNNKKIRLDCAGFARLVLMFLQQISVPTIISAPGIINLLDGHAEFYTGGVDSNPLVKYISMKNLFFTNQLPLQNKGQWIVQLDNDKFIGLSSNGPKLMTLQEWANDVHHGFLEEIKTAQKSVYFPRMVVELLDYNTWYVYEFKNTDLICTETKFHFTSKCDLYMKSRGYILSVNLSEFKWDDGSDDYLLYAERRPKHLTRRFKRYTITNAKHNHRHMIQNHHHHCQQRKTRSNKFLIYQP